MHASRGRRPTAALLAAALFALGATACTGDDKPKGSSSSPNASATAPSSAAAPTSSAPASTAASTRSAAATPDGGNCSYRVYGGAVYTGVEKIDLKSAKLGFAQSEKDDNPFHATETQSMRDEAKRLGYTLAVTNAGGDLAQQITDIKSLVAQGVQAVIVSPLKSEGLQPALDEAKAKRVPVLTVDRPLAQTFRLCTDYVGFVGSDFAEQGRRAGAAMIKATGGTAKAVTLLGSPDVAATEERNAAYRDAIAGTPGIEVVAEQTANANRADGQKATEQLLASHPDLTAIFAHNDEAALGAKAALEAAGKKAGDVRIVAVDGTKAAVQAIIDGWFHGAIESNPRLGALTFAALDAFYNGDGVPPKQTIQGAEYTPANASEQLPNAY